VEDRLQIGPGDPRSCPRKVGATIAANDAATDDQLMVIFGSMTKKQSGHYTRNADRKRLAGKAMHKLMRNEKWTELSRRLRWLKKVGKNRQIILTKSTAGKTVGAQKRTRTSTPCGTRT
jgi:hypothetical protein